MTSSRRQRQTCRTASSHAQSSGNFRSSIIAGGSVEMEPQGGAIGGDGLGDSDPIGGDSGAVRAMAAPLSRSLTTGASSQSGKGNADQTSIHRTRKSLSTSERCQDAGTQQKPGSCRSCLFSGLEPATEADAYGRGGRFIRTCALGKRPAAARSGCASWARDPGEQAITPAALAHAVRRAREARI